MIEWIIGAAVLGGIGSLFSKEEKTPRQRQISSSSRKTNKPVPPPCIDANSDYSEWRAQWEKTVDWSRWIPKSRATEIIRDFPPFENGGSAENPIVAGTNDLILPWTKQGALDRCEEALLQEFASHNASILVSQREKNAAFFDTIERNPLTDEQMSCCICMDDAVQIVAAAGSGKTSTIVARVGYALKERLVQPEQILILAFNVSVKKELEARLKERLSDIANVDRINVKTFNAFGLEVIGKTTGRKPRMAEWVVNDNGLRAISEIVDDLRQNDPRFRYEWDMFRTIFGRDIGGVEVQNEASLMSSGRGTIRTADGKWVKSQEERMICDFLFYHGVQYEYERPYEHDTVTEEHSQYHPDFYYPRIQLYHEHFALDAEGNAPEHFSGDYVEGARWKRSLHAEMETQLFETTSYGLRDGDDLDRLKRELEQRGEAFDFDAERAAQGQEPIPSQQLASTIRAFQQHVKSNRLSHQDLQHTISKLERGHRDRLKRFVKLYEKIADEWQRRLQAEECVDFDDMLLNAIQHIETGAYQSPYSMMLADEFQDVSQAKLQLLKALKNNAGPSANLCVVGDDWQGINRFAGADISVMTGFGETFPHSTQLTLSKTFRCPQVICDASSAFIQKNPKQIKKIVDTTNTYERPGLFVFAAKTEQAARERLEKSLEQIARAAQENQLDLPQGKKASVMLLGRYHRDKPASLGKWQRAYGAYLDLSFSTAHASKGLEADYVMLLNVTSGKMGFPSQISDDPVLQLAMPDPDDFLMAEERRLFYVALTRARRQTRIYTLENKPSRFVLELAKDGYTEIKTAKATLKVCPKCETGTLVQKNSRFGPFETCSTYPGCDYKKNLLSIRQPRSEPGQSVRLKEPISEGDKCPVCNRGSMVSRDGRNGAPFLGCSSYPRCRTTAPLNKQARSQMNGTPRRQ